MSIDLKSRVMEIRSPYRKYFLTTNKKETIRRKLIAKIRMRDLKALSDKKTSIVGT